MGATAVPETPDSIRSLAVRAEADRRAVQTVPASAVGSQRLADCRSERPSAVDAGVASAVGLRRRADRQMERLSAADVGAASVAGSLPPEDRMERLSVPVGEMLRAAVPTAAAHGGRPEPAAALNVQPVAGVRHARQAVAAERGGRPVAAVRGAEAVPAWLRAPVLPAGPAVFAPTHRWLSSPIPRQRTLRREGLLREV